ncbi:hypothetical protein [Gordonia sp. (in: high G+C Gram-positive bacteria)]|uniref:hypothetical protein n=1 Tax=Gordonia sp. (in: high G+C Gram-positive bacteria) TaxID=84139 RepID=UPI0039E2C6C7
MSEESKPDEALDDTVDEVTDEATDTADEAADAADEATEAVDEQPAAGRSASGDTASKIAWATAILIAVIGLIVGVWGAYTGVRAYTAKSSESVRDGVLESAQTAILNITTLDPKDPQKFKANIESSLTGKALDEMRASEGYKSLLNHPQARGRTQSRVIRSAVTELNADAKSGKALVFVETVAKVPGQPEVPQVMVFTVTVDHTDSGYKASSLEPLSGIQLQRAASPVGAQQGSGQGSGQQDSGQSGSQSQDGGN